MSAAPSVPTEASLTATFAALADPTRRAILTRLAGGEASVSELAEPFEMSMPAISKHLGVLERAGLIASRHEAQWRPRHLVAARFKGVADWVEPFRVLWDRRFDRMEGYLQDIQKKERKHARSTKE